MTVPEINLFVKALRRGDIVAEATSGPYPARIEGLGCKKNGFVLYFNGGRVEFTGREDAEKKSREGEAVANKVRRPR